MSVAVCMSSVATISAAMGGDDGDCSCGRTVASGGGSDGGCKTHARAHNVNHARALDLGTRSTTLGTRSTWCIGLADNTVLIVAPSSTNSPAAFSSDRPKGGQEHSSPEIVLLVRVRCYDVRYGQGSAIQ
jgi:hypothetical protein